jgi:E3 ubiquitin-protein ligase CCNP1IP1
MTEEQDALRRKNEELAQAYKEKSRKLLQVQELYDKAKRRAEMGHIRRAASDAVDSTLHHAHNLVLEERASPRGFDIDMQEASQGFQTMPQLDAPITGANVQKPGMPRGSGGNQWPPQGLSSRGRQALLFQSFCNSLTINQGGYLSAP